MNYDHTRSADLHLLADAVLNLPAVRVAQLNAWLAGEGIMRTHRSIELMLRVAAWWKSTTIEDRWMVVYLRNHEINADARASFLEHLLYGKNEWDAASAGGFGEVELARIVMKLRELGAPIFKPGMVA